ncbi:MAG: GYF domain-containing protein [Candidatus Amulumruptor caecigallinarius]|nr:GYF domain-containing protein [Candidatus Amulumruptor caecigallinarius]
MIENERRGPFTLGELPEAGVGPDTYVWCKGMNDWEKAEDVADICRFFRQRIFSLSHPRPATKPEPSADADKTPASWFPPVDENVLYSEAPSNTPPPPTLLLALLVTILCFPVTGLVAVFYSYAARRAWEDSQRDRQKRGGTLYSERDRDELRLKAHDYATRAKMWIGISFFLGLMLYAFLGKSFM